MRSALFTTPRMWVSHANSYHGSLAWGFPGPTAWVGLMTALNLKLKSQQVVLDGVSVLSYAFHPITYQSKFGQKPSPPRASLSHAGTTRGIQETQGAYANLEVAFVFRASYVGDPETALHAVCDTLQSMRFAGGSVFPTSHARAPWFVPLSGDRDVDAEAFQKAKRGWTLSSILTLRPDLLKTRLDTLRATNPKTTKLSAWLDLFSLAEDKGSWTRTVEGWVVPVTTGFQAVSPLYAPGVVAGTRDPTEPFQFVESIWDVGEWRSPFRIEHPGEMLFQPSYNASTSTYRCITEPHNV